MADEKADATAFERLWSRQPTDEDRKRLLRTREALGLGQQDALFDVLVALDYYQQLYSKIPDAVKAASRGVLEDAAKTAEKAAKGVEEQLKAKVADAAARVADQVAKGVVRRELMKAATVAGLLACAASVLVGGVGYWLGRETSLPATVSGLSRTEAEELVDLAKSGALKTILTCGGPGWEVRDGMCYPQPTKGTVYGWRMPRKR